MKQEKFNITITRDALRVRKNGKISNLAYPKAFGNKEKNNFIRADKEDCILEIITPKSKSVSEVYNKLEEITNVVMLEMHDNEELLWPASQKDEKELKITLKLTIDEEYYQELVDLDKGSIPEKLEDGIKEINTNLKEDLKLLKPVFGDVKVKCTKHDVKLENINLNYNAKCGITEKDIYVLVSFIFGALKKDESSTLSKKLKHLESSLKNYGLKNKEALKELASSKENQKRLDEEAKLSFEEMLKLAENHLENGYIQRYKINKYDKLVAESVAIIKDAISQGIDYKILNEEKSVVEFSVGNKKEFVIEGNKTDRDSYIFPIITDDKFIAKEIMANASLNVPKAILLDKEMDQDEIEGLVNKFYNTKLVVKPRNTNYGIGITVFSKPATKKQILNAIEYAFKFDTNVLIEEYAKGMEFRFLVIDGKCLSVAHRRIASVVGDGKSTIKELIAAKNKEPWHYLTGTPVKSDEPVVEYLKLQNLTFESVPAKDKRIFLRTNSNCSTGGESVDYTYTMPNKFKKIAEKAARAFDAKICGVDIIIEDFDKDDYAIIEINDNPGYSINEWPYEGEGERIGLAILDLLDLKQI